MMRIERLGRCRTLLSQKKPANLDSSLDDLFLEPSDTMIKGDRTRLLFEVNK